MCGATWDCAARRSSRSTSSPTPSCSSQSRLCRSRPFSPTQGSSRPSSPRGCPGRSTAAAPPMVFALAWLDWHLLRNRARTIARNPRRLLPWLLFLFLLVPNLAGRFLTASTVRRQPPGVPLDLLPVLLGRFVPGAALVLLGFALWQSRGRAPAGFQSP